MSFRKIMLVVLTLVLAFSVLAACGSNNGGSKSGNSSTNTSKDKASNDKATAGDAKVEDVELRYPWWGNVSRHEKYNKLMDMFEAANPDITIVREPATWGDYWDKIPTQTAGGNPPDVLMWTTEGQIAEYIAKNAVLSLDEYIADGTIDISNFDQTALGLGQIKGKQYMLTKGLAAYVIHINEGLLESKNIALPTYDMTWDEMVSYMREIKPQLGTNEKGEEIYPIWIKPSDNKFLESWMRQQGKELFSEDGKSFGFSKEDLIGLFEFYLQLQEEGLTPPPNVVAELSGQDWEMGMLALHRIVMDFRPGNHLKVMQRHMEDRLNLVRFPSTNGKHGEIITGAFLGISAHSENPDAVARLINTWMNDLEFNKLYEHEHGIIANKKLLEEMETTMDPADKITTANMLDVLATTEAQPQRVPGMAPINDQLKKSLEEIEYGVKSVEAAVDDIFNAADKALAGN
jgi:multiple sugar transport system substrate-binding protein